VTEDSLPQEAEKLLATAPAEFVAERGRLAKKLRDDDRPDDAAAVAGLRKPSAVVFAVNRAARDRPKAAREAAKAALRVKKTQVGNQPDAFKQALADLDAALELLAEVAVAHVAPSGKPPTDAMRRRVRDLLRGAVADDDARDALARGALTEELEAVGFSPFAGLTPAPAKKHAGSASGPTRAQREDAKRRERERALREELADAEQRLQDAEKALREADRERKAAERSVLSLRSKLDRSD
jgi:hypothetical protein